MSDAHNKRVMETRAAFLRLFNSADGDLVMQELERFGGADRCSFAAGDPHRTAFNEGRRSVVLHIRSMMEPVRAGGQEDDNG
jgi:hypothetical protein